MDEWSCGFESVDKDEFECGVCLCVERERHQVDSA